MEHIPCPTGIKHCYVTDSDGGTKGCLMWDKEENMCSLNITELFEARRFLEQSADTSNELRFSALRGAVEKILEHLEEAEG